LNLSSPEKESKMGNTPSIPTDPTKTTLVIGAGFSRTGTVSLSLALERLLGSPVCHSGTAILGREEGMFSVLLPLIHPVQKRKENEKNESIKTESKGRKACN
jgi:hypothetical protein